MAGTVSLELDPIFLKGLGYLHSKSKDSAEKLKALLDESLSRGSDSVYRTSLKVIKVLNTFIFIPDRCIQCLTCSPFFRKLKWTRCHYQKWPNKTPSPLLVHLHHPLPAAAAVNQAPQRRPRKRLRKGPWKRCVSRKYCFFVWLCMLLWHIVTKVHMIYDTG